MSSALYFLSKFSQEALLVELFLISLITTCYFGYLLLKKRRLGINKQQIPDNVVRAFLSDMISNAEGFKNQLFGENFKITAGPGLKMPEMPATAGPVLSGNSQESTALKSQLAAAQAKHDELAKAIAQLSSDKAALEAKIAAAPAGGAGPAGGELQDKVAKLEAKLAEYEVIEDDLANLKKYQQENKQLRTQLEAAKNGQAAVAPAMEQVAPAPAAAAPAPAPVPAAPAPTPAAAATPAAAPAADPAPASNAAAPAPAASPIAAAEETVTQNQAAQSFETLVDKVEESLTPAPTIAAAPAAAPVGASVKDPAAPAPAAPAAAASAAEAAAPPAGDKSDADLLSEFERMLNS